MQVGLGPAFGMAQVIAGLLREACMKEPGRAAALKGSIVLQSSDHASGVTVHFEGDRIRVMPDNEPDAALTVEAPTGAFGRLGSPSYAVGAYLRREIRVRGMFRHPILLNKMRRLLAALDLEHR